MTATPWQGRDSESFGFQNILYSKANGVARVMVTKYGMSEKLGPITFGKNEELVFLGKEISSERNYSEKVAAEITPRKLRLPRTTPLCRRMS